MNFTRRKALKLSIAALFTSQTNMTSAQAFKGKKIIVIGAGLAGLSAAKNLQENGAKVTILEAGNYVGGRVRTNMSLGAPFEYGAGWIHGPSHDNPTQQLAQQIGAHTIVTDDENIEIFAQDGSDLSDRDYERLEDIYTRLEAMLYAEDAPESQSVYDALSSIEPELLEDPLSQWILSAYFEFSIGASIKDISARNGFASEEFDGDDVIFTQGYDKIIAPLAKNLDIQLNTPVSEIFYSNSGVEVDGLKADYVVCAVPLAVLKAEIIAFDPPLPKALKTSIDEIGFGTVTKIAFKFEDAFWNTESQYFGMMTKPMGRWNHWINYRTFSDENILLGLSFGTYAPIADQMSDVEMTEDALTVLRDIWGSDVPQPEAVLTTHWSQEPNFRGTYSYAQAGGSLDQFKQFEKPLKNRIFFAGEHTFARYLGTTHGALLSGARAAKLILEL